MKLLLMLLLTVSAMAQGVRYDNRVTTVASNGPSGASSPVMAIPNSTVTICTDGSCTITAKIFSNQGLTVKTGNPMQTDGQGRFGFWAASGNYFYQAQTPTGTILGPYPFTLGGSSGVSGPAGPTGATGAQGPAGPTGPSGGGAALPDSGVVCANSTTVGVQCTPAQVAASIAATPIAPSSVTSPNINSNLQATSLSVTGLQATINSAGTTGSVTIPTNLPPLAAGPAKNSATVITTGGSLGPGTYTYTLCGVLAGVEQKCNTTFPTVVTSGTTNIVQIGFTPTPGISIYNMYGRIAGSPGFIRQIPNASATSKYDDGSITPGASPTYGYSNLNGIKIEDLRYGVLAPSGTAVPVRMFGCAEDGITDDRACIQAAINYAKTSGINVVQFTPGKTYAITSIGGTFPLPGDDGSCPTGATVGGVACTTLAPESTDMQAYSLWIPGGVTVDCAGASLNGAGTNGAIPSLTSPVLMLLQNSLTVTTGGGIPGYSNSTNTTVFNCSMRATIAMLAPGVSSFNNIHDVSCLCGAMYVTQISDRSQFKNWVINAGAGLVVGGWWTQRGNVNSNVPGNWVESGGYNDGLIFDHVIFTNGGTFLANAAPLDSYFDTYFFKTANNSNGRLVDVPGTSSPSTGIPTQAPYRGIFGRASTTYARYIRPNNGITINNVIGEFPARETIYVGNFTNQAYINNIGAEGGGTCNGNSISIGTGDPVNCPDPWGTGSFIPGVVNSASGGLISNIASGRFYPDTVAKNDFHGTVSNAAQTSSTTVVNHGYFSGGKIATATTSFPGGYSTWCGSGWQSSSAGAREDCWQLQPTAGIGQGGGSILSLAHLAGGITGPMEVAVPALDLSSQTAPTCSALYGGSLFYTAGATSVADIAQICTKDASNAYAYHSILDTSLGGVAVSGTPTPGYVLTSTSPTAANWQSPATVTMSTYGAFCDGTEHHASAIYSTLAAAQAVYPSAVSLADEFDQLAFEKARAVLLATSAGGGTISVPAGVCMVGRVLTVPMNGGSTTGGINVVGQGSRLSIFKPDAAFQLANNNAVIAVGNGLSDTVANGLGRYANDKSVGIFQGFGVMPTCFNQTQYSGNAPKDCQSTPVTSAMVGIATGSGRYMKDIQVQGFAKGISIVGDHFGWDQVDTFFNGFGVAFDPSNAALFGDLAFKDCIFNQNTEAAIWISKDAYASVTVSGQLMTSYSPYAIYGEAGNATSGGYFPMLLNWSSQNILAEGLGLGFIQDGNGLVGTGSQRLLNHVSMYKTQLLQGFAGGSGPGFAPGHITPSTQYYFDVGGMEDFVFEYTGSGSMNNYTGQTGTFHMNVEVGNNGAGADFYLDKTIGTTANLPVLSGGFDCKQVKIRIRGEWEGTCANIVSGSYFGTTYSALNAGLVMDMIDNNLNTMAPEDPAKRVDYPFGVLMQSYTSGAAGQTALVATSGIVGGVPYTGTPSQAGIVGVSSAAGAVGAVATCSATPGGAAGCPGAWIVGQTTGWNAGNSTQSVRLMLAGAGGPSLGTVQALWTGCSGTQVLQFNGTCIASSTATLGTVTLASGTATISTTASAAVGTVNYSLSHCGPNSSTAIGTLSTGTIVAGTSFVINALTATNTVATGDASTVCWEIK